MKKLNIALVGYGGIGRVHLMGYRSLPFHYGLPADTIKIVGVATSRPETAAKAAAEIGCEISTADYHDLLARDDVDVIDCCTPNYKHEEIVLAAAEAGKHIYCEKPLANNVAEARRMVEAVAQAGVKGQMTFNFRFLPAISRARQLIEAGFLGRFFSFRGRYYRASYVDPDRPLSWKLRAATSGTGALGDIGVHILDLIYYLLGDFASVQAILETIIKDRPVAAGAIERGPVDVDDLAFLHLRLANGALGLVEISRLGTGTTNDLQIELYGDKGALRFNSTDPNWLEVYDMRDPEQPLGGMRGFRKLETVQHYQGQKAPDWTMPPSFVRSHAECQYQFLRAISDDLPPSPSLVDGLRVQEVMEAAVRSSAESRWVTVDEVRALID
ncbi:MAG: Gfo/Idh/MocA family oxidoreductase [Chloroflexota bacterium]